MSFLVWTGTAFWAGVGAAFAGWATWRVVRLCCFTLGRR